MARRKAVAKVTQWYANGVLIGSEYFYSLKEAQNFASNQKGWGRKVKLVRM